MSAASFPVFVPLLDLRIPGRRCEAHEQLKDLVGDFGAVAFVVRQSKEDVKSAAQDEYESEDGNKVHRHQTKRNEELRKVLVVVQDAEDTRQEQNSVGGQNIVGHVIPVMRIDHKDTIRAHAVIHNQQDENSQVKKVPDAHDVQCEALLVEAHELVKHEAGAPEPEYQLKGGDLDRPFNQYSQEEPDQNGEGQGREEGPIARNSETGEFHDRGLSRVIQHHCASAGRDLVMDIFGRDAGEERSRRVDLGSRTATTGPQRVGGGFTVQAVCR